MRKAVVDHVKESIKEAWKEKRIDREAYKTIVRKAVEKVSLSCKRIGGEATIPVLTSLSRTPRHTI